jgi:hypothetical protein
LEIISTDRLANPKITYPMFGHKDDLKIARLAVCLYMRLAAEFQAVYPLSAPLAFALGNEMQALQDWEQTGAVKPSTADNMLLDSKTANKTWANVTDDEIDDYMRRVGHTALHFSGTCPIGTDEKNGVVDQRLLVFGPRLEKTNAQTSSKLHKVTCRVGLRSSIDENRRYSSL